RWIQHPAIQIHANRHVFLLHDIPSHPIASSFLGRRWAPALVRSWVRRCPEWFLPQTAILKERNPAKADAYDNEIAVYRHLVRLQGHAIPQLLGEAGSYDPTLARYQVNKRPIPAFLLKHVQGSSLHDLSPEELGDDDLIRALQDVYDALTQHGVFHGDPRLHNFLRVGDRVVAIDLELASPLPCDVTRGQARDDQKRDRDPAAARRLGTPAAVVGRLLHDAPGIPPHHGRDTREDEKGGDV
ncbi:hypothetical protein C8A05DRAFT_20225, partial [Staphylotrichum tortipilum]